MFMVPSHKRLRRAKELFQIMYDPGLDQEKKISLKNIIGEMGKI